jgi:hypothetical protein
MTISVSTNPTTSTFFIREYYHTATQTGQSYDFIISSNGARYNRYDHDFSTADPAKKIQHVNDSVMDTAICIQGFSGIYSRLRFPNISQYKDSLPISVNKAKLVFSVLFDGDIFTSTTVPANIYLTYTTSTGVKTLVPDYYVSTSFYDGNFNSTTFQYSFNIAQFIQEYLTGKIPSSEVEMRLPDGEYKNVILKSIGSKSPPEFTLVYTRF